MGEHGINLLRVCGPLDSACSGASSTPLTPVAVQAEIMWSGVPPRHTFRVKGVRHSARWAGRSLATRCGSSHRFHFGDGETLVPLECGDTRGGEGQGVPGRLLRLDESDDVINWLIDDIDCPKYLPSDVQIGDACNEHIPNDGVSKVDVSAARAVYRVRTCLGFPTCTGGECAKGLVALLTEEDEFGSRYARGDGNDRHGTHGHHDVIG